MNNYNNRDRNEWIVFDFDSNVISIESSSIISSNNFSFLSTKFTLLLISATLIRYLYYSELILIVLTYYRAKFPIYLISLLLGSGKYWRSTESLWTNGESME